MGFLKKLIPGNDPISKAVIDREVKNRKEVREFLLDKDDKKTTTETKPTPQTTAQVGSPDIGSLSGASSSGTKPGQSASSSSALSSGANSALVGASNDTLMEMLIQILIQLLGKK